MSTNTTMMDRGVETDAMSEWERIRDDRGLLSVRGLQTHFKAAERTVEAVNGVSFEMGESEILGLIGESGCGKSATCRSLMRLIEPPGEIVGGEVVFKGEDILTMDPESVRRLRGNEISMIFQEPESALNPVLRVGKQIGEPLRVHQGYSKQEARQRAIELMEQVGIPSPAQRIDDYPHEFSGGMAQRAVIAMALACEPDLLIADEPTTNLDVTIEAQILDLLDDLRDRLKMSVLMVTHDLGVAAAICDRIAVMYAGRIVEYGDVEEIFADPRHPYTRGLLNSLPDPETGDDELISIPGEVPDPSNLPEGCHYADRCNYAVDQCREVDPRMMEVTEGRYSACIWEDPQ